MLRAQLVVAGVPLRPGFVPWVLLRRMTNGSVVADCARHEKCALTCSRSPGHHAAVKVAGSPLPFVMPECWPPCPREEETLEHFLYRDQIKHLRSQGLWPFASEEQAPASSDYGALDDALHENTNRPPWARDDDDDGDDDDDDDDDGGDDDDAAAGNLPPR